MTFSSDTCERALAPNWHGLSKEKKGLLDNGNIKADTFPISNLREFSRSYLQAVPNTASNKSELSTENITWFSKLLLKVSWRVKLNCTKKPPRSSLLLSSPEGTDPDFCSVLFFVSSDAQTKAVLEQIIMCIIHSCGEKTTKQAHISFHCQNHLDVLAT